MEKVTNALEFSTSYSYSDAEEYDGSFGPGDLLSVTDANNNVTEFRNDAFGNATQMRNAVGIVTTRVYDVRGRLLKETDTRRASRRVRV